MRQVNVDFTKDEMYLYDLREGRTHEYMRLTPPDGSTRKIYISTQDFDERARSLES